MKKYLRFLSVAFLAMISSTMMAQTITFDASTDKGTCDASNPGADQVTKDGVMIAISNGAMNLTDQYRCYKGSTFTVTSTVGNITKVEFTCTAEGAEKYGPGCFTDPTSGSYSFEGNAGTWKGDAESFSLTSSTNQVRMNTVVVTIGGGTPSTKTETTIEFSGNYETRATCGKDEKVSLPTATVKAGDAAVTGATITWSCSNEDLAKIEGAKISIPNHVYGNVKITATYAGNDTYEASKKDYTLTIYKGYMSLNSMWEDFADENNGAELKAGVLGSYWQVAMDGDNIVSKEALVTYVNASYTYINDGANDMLLYGANLGFKQGDKITGDLGDGKIGAIYGTLKTYNGLLEFATSVDDIEFKVVSSDNAVEPKLITPEALADNMNAYVKIACAKFTSVNGRSLTFVSPDGMTFTVYNQWNADVTALEQDKSYELIGTGGYYKDACQFNLISFKEVDASAINLIQMAEQAGTIYNVAGQLLSAPQRGINIIGGRKVFVK